MTDPTFVEAEFFFSKGDLQMAEAKYSEFIDLSLHYFRTMKSVDKELLLNLSTALNNRGQIKYQRVDFDEAIEDYTLALQHRPDFAVAFYNRGQIHYRLARFQEGISDFQHALAIQADFPDCHLALKTAQMDMEEMKEKMCNVSPNA